MLPRLWPLFVATATALNFLSDVPREFEYGPSKWAWYDYSMPSVAVLPGAFNRTAFDAPWVSNTSNSALTKMLVALPPKHLISGH
jgi:hypothetical protein